MKCRRVRKGIDRGEGGGERKPLRIFLNKGSNTVKSQYHEKSHIYVSTGIKYRIRSFYYRIIQNINEE